MNVKALLQNKALRNGGVFAFFSFLNQGINFLLLIVLSWFLLPDSYGKLNLFYTSSAIISILIPLGTNGILGVKYFRVNQESLSKYLNVILLCVLSMTILLMSLIALWGEVVSKKTGIESNFLLICIYISSSSIFYHILGDIYRLEERPTSYGLLTIIYTVLNAGGSLLFVISFRQDWYGRIWANILTVTLFLLVTPFILYKKGYLRRMLPNQYQIKETLSFGVPLIPHQLTNWLKQGMDRFIINAHFITSLVGLFSFAYNFANIISIAGTAFNQSNSVFIFKCLSENEESNRNKLRKQTLYMLGMFFILTIGVIVLSWVLIPILFPAYSESNEYLFPLCMAAFFQCVYLLFCNYLFYYKKTKRLMYITLITAIIHLILSLIFTHYSVLITAYISMLSSFLQALLVFLHSKKLYKLF